MPQLIMQLFQLFAPIVQDLVAKHRAENNGADPTEDELTARFHADIAEYLGEGARWRFAHPKETDSR